MGYILSFSPFDISKNFAFGLGVGVGIGVVIRKVFQEKQRQRDHLISCLKQLAAEVRQLRDTLLQAVHVSSAQKENNLLEICNESSGDEDEFFDTEKETEETSIEDLESFLAKIDKLQDGTSAEKQDAYNLLIIKAGQNTNKCELLWRLAKAQFQISELKDQAGDRDSQQLMLSKGIESGKNAINVDESNFNAHKWYATLVGSHIKFLDTKEKILAGYEYKKHIEIAIDINPKDATCYYLLGRYFYEIYMLPWYMRKAAATLFAEPPTATADDALHCFLTAEKLRPGFYAENPLYIGKVYYQMSDYTHAKEWLNKTIDLCSNSKEKAETKAEAVDLLHKC